MQWISCDGGPFVFMPKRIANFWNQGEHKDYELSYLYEGFYNDHVWNLYRILFLETEGGAITWVKGENFEGGYLLAWVAGPENLPESVLKEELFALENWDKQDLFECNKTPEEYVLFAACDTFPDGIYRSLEMTFHCEQLEISICQKFSFTYQQQKAQFLVLKFQGK